MDVATVASPKWAEVAVHHTRPASTNTQLSSAASCLLNDCCFLLFINAAVLATVGELGERSLLMINAISNKQFSGSLLTKLLLSESFADKHFNVRYTQC